MKARNLKYLLLAAVMTLVTAASAAATDNGLATVKKERNHIRAGNKHYAAKRYAEAEAEYRLALQEAPASPVAQFNLASALMRQGSATAAQDSKNNPINDAQEILERLAKDCPDRGIRGKAAYDLGNIAYARQQWPQAIEHYKNALRSNPDDDQARHNLRLAQLKQQEQQNQDKNKDNNKDKDKNQDNNKDRDKNQDNNKDQDKNQDNKKDKDKDKNGDNDRDKDQNRNNKQDGDNGQPQNPNKDRSGQGQQGMSQQNAEQVLKAMQDQERATQQRVNARKAQQQRGERARTNRKW